MRRSLHPKPPLNLFARARNNNDGTDRFFKHRDRFASVRQTLTSDAHAIDADYLLTFASLTAEDGRDLGGMNMNSFYALDLTQRPPRSMRVRLGGYAILARMLDKCRATIAGKNGEFHFNCPLDQHIINFVGIDPEAFKAEVAKGRSDGEMLDWVNQNAKFKRTPWEIKQWSQYHDERGPDSDAETLMFFAEAVGKLSKTREDIRTWAELLDFDDYVTFGGK